MSRALWEKLSALGIELRAEGDRLNYRAPNGVMTIELLGQIKSNKPALLALAAQAEAIEYLNQTTDRVVSGNCLAVLQKLPDNSIDLVVTDPPYGIEFMGKQWDKALPDGQTWKECCRVLKPGGFAFVMASPRQDVLSRMIVSLEQAGLKTGFSSLYWTYASGFPKAHNIGKAVSNRPGDPERVKMLEGSYGGFQPKPAVEVIIVAMKPLDQKGYTNQALTNGKGVTWLDDCRIPYNDDADATKAKNNFTGDKYNVGITWSDTKRLGNNFNDAGRFPANLLVSDGILDDGKITKSPNQYDKKHAGFRTDYVGGKERTPELQTKEYGNSGTYSRFFSLDAWADLHLEALPDAVRRNLPYLIVPKASRRGKDAGLDAMDKTRPSERRNIHPTVKPIQLMAYLITMGSRENDIVLDPFAGSGTTLIAARMLKRRFIGIELVPEYHEIAEQRIDHHSKISAGGQG
jgi:site-specific DNA-methyltransferase (adenine-specific)